MEVIEIKPNGFCGGVKRCLSIINDGFDLLPRPIYMLGYIIHNKMVVEEFTKRGVILVTEDPITFIEKIDKGTIIVTAHGINPKVIDIATQKNIHIVDTTCHNVSKIHNIVKTEINNNKNVYVIGNKHHPEVKGILGISDNIKIYESYQNISDNSFIINQTTLNYDDLLNEFQLIKTYNTDKNITICDEVCNATKVRQNAIKENAKLFDLIIIVGDKLSNNCKSLIDVSLKLGVDAFLVESVDDINEIDLTKYKKIGVSAGASTPRILIDSVINYLHNIK